ncbi:MAG: 3-beta hydroxysteroid dehydrogenase [Alphaproteobacteria bacterium]|nr:MAG: 3-beta hydroxysteroid dehydrogenase [Alphaproteobacteria bacterium]
MARLNGKICLITGAAQGLGEAMANVLAREQATLILCDINMERLTQTADKINASGGNAIALKLDVTQEEEWQTVEKYIAKEYGHLDVLVNNAGVEVMMSVEETSFKDWRAIQSVNVDGVFLGCKIMLNLLKETGIQTTAGASIINLSSVAGIVGVANLSAYCSSKGAVRNLSKSLAIEFAEGRHNIRVNSIHPGFIQTPMLQDLFTRWAAEGIMGNTLQEVELAAADTQPLGRFGQPEDIAYGVLYLASDEANFVTGSELVIDGAWTAR